MNDKPQTLHITTVDLTAWCFLRSWFKHLRAYGYPVTLACTVSKFRQDLLDSGAEVVNLPISRKIAPWQDAVSLWKLIRLIRKLRPEIVHTHTSKAGFLGCLAARICRVPHIVHTIHELPQNATRSVWKKRFYWFLEFIATKWWRDQVITVSAPNYRQIIAEHIATPERLTLIREGLDLSKYNAYLETKRQQATTSAIRQEFSIPAQAPFLCSVGRLETAKGHGDLLQAFSLVLRRFPEARLVIVGAGCLQSQLQQQLEDLGLEGRATLAGWREDMLDILASCDLYVLASHYEGLGIANMEAMALAKPVVCTGVGGVLDVVVDGQTGYLSPAHRPDIFAAKICAMLENPDKMRECAQNGYRRVAENFHDAQTNAAMLELYENILAN